MKTIKTLDLRGENPGKRDLAISRTVAIHVLGSTWVGRNDMDGEDMMCGKDGKPTPLPFFATSANVALRLLEENTCFWKCESPSLPGRTKYLITIRRLSDRRHFTGAAPAGQFPLAACIALLRANGIDVLI